MSLSYRLLSNNAPTADFNFYGPKLDPRINFTRATSANTFTSTGNMTSISSGNPRFDYTPHTTTPLGCLMEEARTNVCLRSATFSNASWAQTTITVGTDNITDPSGTSTYDTLTATGASSSVLQTISGLTNGTTYCFSVDLIRVTGTGTINITADGTTMVPVTLTGTLTRFSTTVVCGVSGSLIVGVQIVTSGDAVGCGGADLEAGTYMTSRLNTAASTVARNLDQAAITLPLPFYTSGNISIYANFEVINNTASTATRILVVSDGTSSNRIVLTCDTSNNLICTITVNGSGVSTATGLTVTFGTIYKAAVTIGPYGVQCALNGVLGTALANVSPQIVPMTTVNFGPSAAAGCIHLKDVKFFKTALTSAQILLLTS